MSECPFSFLVFIILCLSQVAYFLMCQNCCFHEQRIWFKKKKVRWDSAVLVYFFFLFFSFPWCLGISKLAWQSIWESKAGTEGFFSWSSNLSGILKLKRLIYTIYSIHIYILDYITITDNLKWIQKQRQFNDYNVGKNAQGFWEKLRGFAAAFWTLWSHNLNLGILERITLV